MKLKFQFISEKPVILKRGYNALIQGLIYNLLDKAAAGWLHEEGFQFEKRSFRLFVFSEILERAQFLEIEKKFIFPQKITFYLSSPVDWILEQVAQNTVTRQEIFLGDNRLFISSIEVISAEKVESDKIRINALTPIETHSTPILPNGKKLTYYYSPTEADFSRLIEENLKKKWSIIRQEDCPYRVKTYPVREKFCKERKRSYKGTVIKGYTGHFWLEGDRQLLQLALDAGLGSRNSQGFGMIELVR